MNTKPIILMALIATIASCSNKTQEKVPAINMADLDTTVAPGEDFYAYSTGGWQKNHPLKPEFSRYGSFDVLGENNQIRINDLFKELASKKNKPGTEAQKIADLYKMGLDSVRMNQEGAAPVKPVLEKTESIIIEAIIKAIIFFI